MLAYSASGLAELRRFRRQDTVTWACQQVSTAPGQITENGDGTNTATGVVPLAALEPGNYILRIVATPPQGDEIGASQWIDFEVLP